MPTAEQLLVRIDATTDQLRREFARADRAIEQFDRKTKGTLGQLDSSLRKIDGAFATLSRGMGVLAGAFAVGQIVRFGSEITKTADQIRLLEARVKVLGGTAQTFEQLRGVSLKLGTSLESTASAFSRFRVAGDDIGLTNRQVVTLTETVQKLGRIGGSSGQELAAATQQFAQGLAKGRLDGDELRSVLENLPLLGKAIADSLGVGVGQLRDMGAAGQLTGKVISDAVLAVAEKTDEQFQRLPRTLEQASTNLETEWGRLVTALDDKLSVSRSYQFFLEQLRRGVGAAADAIAPSTLQQLQSTLGQIKAIQEQIARTEQQAARPSERGLADPRRQDSDRTAAERIARLKEEAAALAEVLQRESEHAVNLERLEQVRRQATIDKNTADRLKAVNELISSYERETDVLKLSDVERRKREAADKAEADARKKIAGITDEQVAAVRDAAAAAAAEADAIEKGQKAAESATKEYKALQQQRADTFADLESELRYLTELAQAHEQGAAAVARVEDARKAELAVQRLQLDAGSSEADFVRSMITLQEDQRRKIDAITEAQKEAERAAERMAAEQKKAAEEAKREYDKLLDSIGNISQEKLGDALFDSLKGETLDFAEFLKDTLLRAIADIAAAMLTRQIVIPIAAQVVGAAPGLFGLSGGAAQVAQQAVGRGAGLGSINPLSFVNSGGLYNQFAFSSLGQSLGLSASAGALGASAFGVSAATPAATLALTGPAGGFGTVAGLSTASTGGAVGAAGLGGAAPALTTLGTIAPYALAALAVAAPLLMSGMFSGGPTVGPVGIADFAPGLGRGREFEGRSVQPFTADNGGNGESLRPIAEAIADLIADSADRFSATINESLRFRVANYGGPEGGSGRMQGFEVNAFINQEAERRVAEGLSQEQAIFEALKFAVQEAFTFDSTTLAEAAANTAATTTEELLADLNFAESFERLGEALADLGGTVDANTLALAQQTVAIQDQARAFAEESAQPIVDALSKALELFPGAAAETTQERRTSVRGVYTDTSGTEGEPRRFVEEGTAEFDRLVAAGATVITQLGTVLETVTGQSAAYADNLERIRQATDVAGASVDLLAQQITGRFEPELRGPFQIALEQGSANIEALRSYLEDLNEQITQANEDFPDLNASLVDVTETIRSATADLRGQLIQDFADSIQSQINAATGLGGINTIAGIVDARDLNLGDAAALGIGGADVLRLFDAQIRQAFEGASLTDLGALLDSGQIVDEGARAIVETILQEQALAQVRADELVGLQALQTETQAFADAARSNARTLRQAAQGLLVDPSLSPLSPELRLQEARRQFEEAFAAANDANPTDEASQDAIQRLPDLSQTLLEASKAYYGSTEGYLADFNRAQEVLNSTAIRQESIEQQQLSALRDIEQAIIDAGGVGSLTPSQRAAAQGYQFGTNASANMRIYDALVAAGLPTPQGFGPTVSGNIGQLRAQNSAVDALLRQMGFATGGSFTVSGPAGNDNLLMPLRLTAGEAVNVSRQDTMSAVVAELQAARADASEGRQLNKALLHEIAQLRRQQARWERRDALAQSSRTAPARRAYGT